MRNSFFFLFITACVVTIVADAAELENLRHWSKPLLMPLLIGHYVVRAGPGNRSLPVIVALFLSFLGDSFLLYEHKDPLYFMLGLGSFLVAHLAYIVVYKHHVHHNDGDELMGIRRVRLAFPIILAGSGLVIVLFPHLGELKLPVGVYAVILVLMVLNALFRFNRTSDHSFWLVFSGALFFMISDSLLAINKFLINIPLGGVWTMITYVVAQFLIVEGVIRHPHRD